MHAFRCPDCGETRWSPFGVAPATPPRCPICTSEMVVERRRPSVIAAPPAVDAERRDVMAHASRT